MTKPVSNLFQQVMQRRFAPAASVGPVSAEEKVFRERQAENRKNHLPNGTGWASVAPGPLSPIGKEFQKRVLARDWDALFTFLPLRYWSRYPEVLGKYSFRDENGKRVYIPFTEDEIRRWVFSPYYSIQPGYNCSDAQREAGVAAYMKAGARHKQKFRNIDPRHIWPIFPGGGYGDQSYGCQKEKKSTWVKIRKGVVAAAAIVAAVYLGPAALAAVQNGASALTGGLIPAAGGGAGAAGAGAGAATSAASGSKVLSGAKTLVGYVNKANTIKAIANGQLPPPPIGIGGASFGQWAMIVAKDEIKKEAMNAAMEAGTKYIEKKMTQKEEQALQAEIAEMQRQLLAITPKNVIDAPPQPVAELATPVKNIQDAEVKQSETLKQFLVPGAIVAAALLLGA